MNSSSRAAALAATLVLLGSGSMAAQCPDGTPPPCRSASTVTALRANRALNGRAWIVVPFANVTKSPELEWLRDASVNLLSLDLGRWTDIQVVDDKKVGDLVRELPAPRTAGPLTLNDGLFLARRAGAGTLVMGDIYKLGNGARIAANVFDVKSGTRLRSVTQQAINQDSLLTAFGPMARGVLAVPPPVDTKLGAPGTTSVDAYQEYLLGSTALNKFEVSVAIQHLKKALAIDSTFAMAHYKLSIAYHWGDDPDSTLAPAHALAAARLGSALPARERALIYGRVASSRRDDPQACSMLRDLVARDSSDVEALYGLGECEYHGGWSTPEQIDSVRGRFRGNWNTAIGLFRRVLTLDPSYRPAFAHVLDALTERSITICRTYAISCGNDPQAWTAVIIRDADSLLILPVRDARLQQDQQRRAEATRSRELDLRAAQKIAQEWVDAGPAESRAHLQLGEIDMYLGELDAASRELRQIGVRSDPLTRRDALIDRTDIAIVLGHGTEGRSLLDTLRREASDVVALRLALDVAPAAFGKTRLAASAIADLARQKGWTPERAAYWQELPLAILGVPGSGLAKAEQRYWQATPGDSICAAGLPTCRTTALLPTLSYALRYPRTWWPPFATEEIGFRFGPARGLAIGDTAYVRQAFMELDSLSGARLHTFGDDQMTSVIAADAALALHDSASALRLTRQFVDSVMPGLIRVTSNVPVETRWLFAPRMMLLRADLAAALGHRDEARTWYTKVLDLWSDADPELQPALARVRAALKLLL